MRKIIAVSYKDEYGLRRMTVVETYKEARKLLDTPQTMKIVKTPDGKWDWERNDEI